MKPNVYSAPELATGKISPSSDMWSLGVTLVAALTQHPPVRERLDQDPNIPETVPEPFRGIARDCLRSDPQQRCSITDKRFRLQPGSTLVPTASKKPAKTNRFGLGALVPMAILLLALTFVGINLFTHSNQSSSPASSTSEQPHAVSAPPVSSRSMSNNPEAKSVKTSSDAVVRQVIPDVPRSARNTIQGKILVKVRVDVDSSGKVKSARLVLPGPSKYFAGLALKAAQKWEFSPPESHDQNSSRTWILRFQFGRASTQVIPIREHA